MRKNIRRVSLKMMPSYYVACDNRCIYYITPKLLSRSYFFLRLTNKNIKFKKIGRSRKCCPAV